MKVFLDTLRRHRLPAKGFFTLYAILAVIVSAADILATKMTGDISQAALDLDTAIILRFLGLMTLFTAVKAVAAAVAAYRACRYQGATGHRLRQSFVRHFTGIGLSDLDGKSSGRGLSLFTNELPSTEDFVAANAPKLISGVISALAAFVFMATIRPFETLIFFLMFPLLVWLQAKISAPLQKKAMEVSAARGDFNVIVQDSLQNTAIVAAYSLESALETRYLGSYDRYYKANLGYVRSLLVLVMSGIIATMLPTLFICIAAAFQVTRGQMTMGVFITFTSVSGIAGDWLTMLSQHLRDLRLGMARATQVSESMAEPLEDLTTGLDRFPAHDPVIELEQVSFAYREDTPILRQVSLSIAQGERVAIVGGSGSGKSTVLKLVLALYGHHSGTIRVLGADIGDMARHALRHTLAYVPQDSFLFPGTIRENLLPLGGAVDDRALESACRRAGIYDFIAGLPQGLDTRLTESAENISGGQRQRLAIARALLREADILLLDEATSALDPVTERAVLEGVAAGGGTVVMVAHRRSAIEACDRIIVMENGRVAGSGTHAQLMAQSPTYQALYESFERQEVAHEIQ